MTPSELVTLHFLARDCAWSAVVVAGLVVPWLLAARRLKVPRVVAPTGQKPRTFGALPHHASRTSRRPGRPFRRSGPPEDTGATSGKAPKVLVARDTAVEDAVLACQQLGFAKRDAASVVLGFRAQLPSATCDELVRRALGAMSQGKSRRL